MGLKCWNGSTCTRDCIKPCKPTTTIQATAPTVDWQKLLKVYMTTVLHEEGVTFVRAVPAGKLTTDERAALNDIETEVRRENPADWSGP